MYICEDPCYKLCGDTICMNEKDKNVFLYKYRLYIITRI